MPAKIPIRIIGFGSPREPYIREGIMHFSRMLAAYAQVEQVWLKPQKGLTAAKETEQICEKLKEREMLIVLDGAAAQPDSLQFARMLDSARQQAKSLCFVIGGAFGLPAEIKQKAAKQISLSSQTYSHLLVRLMLLEQLFRGFSILAGHPYHK